ncbi:MAG: 23S rRNA (guanosine(2251)-2'-O)-methyltransferase RlmB [Kiritimatiellae bacterium]|nr:23S rRNA (guanosine(2251)-2'-O)-methyltransferase RlmB [Kiritimatiellia bacterium]
MDTRNHNQHKKGPRELVTGGEWIYGRKPVLEVFRAGRRQCRELILPPSVPGESEDLSEMRAWAQRLGIVCRTEDRKRMDALFKGAHHQNVALKTDIYPYADTAELLEFAETDENAMFVVLDHIEDPQNLGAIVRTACAAGVSGIVVPEDRASLVTPTVVRASAGGTEYVKIAKAVNIVRFIKDLKERNVWITGLDWGDDAKDYTKIDYRGKAAIVVGAEGAGISRLVRQTCDFIAVLPMLGEIQSLNASVAAGIVLYEALRQRSLNG